MKKRTTSLFLALMMCLSLLPVTAAAASDIPAPTNPKAAIDNDVPEAYIDFTDEVIISFGTPDTLRQMLANGEISNITVQVDWSINSETDWKCSGIDEWSSLGEYGREVVNILAGEEVEQVGMFRSNYTEPEKYGYGELCYGITDDGSGYLDLVNNTVWLKMRFESYFVESGETAYSEWTPVFSIGKKVDDEVNFNASEWAKPELQQAQELGLIPDCLDGADLKGHITRAEFAAVCVKTYEELAGTAALPSVVNPFTDTADIEVLKAYNINVVNGTSATTYSPAGLLTREQMATMLTRVFKRTTIPGWTLPNDSRFPLDYVKPAPFADDADISGYARDSVYFMAANGIVGGVGGNRFAPRNTTPEQQARNYAQATREQALVIAVRMVNNLSGD